MKNKPTIFVQIAAYRDPETETTCFDLIQKAANPDRLSIGIIWQGVEGEDDSFIAFAQFFPQIKVEKYDAMSSKGACWARAKAQKLYNGEDYALQIDSHMRFEQGWDEILINMLAECDSDKPLLTTYPPDYEPPMKLRKTHILTMRPKEFTPQNIITFTSTLTPIDKAPDKPIPGIVCAAGFLFGKGSYMQEVPYDPNLYFFGEEISMAVRLWTSGWDFYHPNKLVIYHLWTRKGRNTHSGDHKDWTIIDLESKRRVASMLGTIDDAVDLGEYGLGTARSIEDYQNFSGIDFKNRTISKQEKS